MPGEFGWAWWQALRLQKLIKTLIIFILKHFFNTLSRVHRDAVLDPNGETKIALSRCFVTGFENHWKRMELRASLLFICLKEHPENRAQPFDCKNFTIRNMATIPLPQALPGSLFP